MEAGAQGSGAPHLLVPGTGPRGLPGLRAGLAQPRNAQGQQSQRAAPGSAGPRPCPRPHSARRAGSGARRVAASARGCGRLGRGQRSQEAPALRGAPTALRGRPLRLLATTSPFPLRGRAFLLGPSMTHRSPRVPPSLFHFPLRNVTLSPPRLPVSSPLASQQGVWGEGAKGFGSRVYVTEFPITHSFGLVPETRQLRLPPSNRRAPAPREVAAAGESQSSRRAWVPASQGERGTSLSVLYQTRLGFPLLARRGHSPTSGFRRV